MPVAGFEASLREPSFSVFVVGGGLNRSNHPLHKDGVSKGRGVLNWENMTEGIKHLVNSLKVLAHLVYRLVARKVADSKSP